MSQMNQLKKPISGFTISAVILALISGIILIASIVVGISLGGENPTAGPMAITDGCCYGGLGLILSCFIFGIAWLVQVGGLYLGLKRERVEMIPPKQKEP